MTSTISPPDTTRRRFTARDLALIAIFAGLMAALGWIPPIVTPLSPLPITAQSLGVLLAGAILGPWRGAASQLLFLGLVAIGLPLLAGGRGTIAVFVGPSVGFLIGYVVVAFLVGYATYRIGSPYRLGWGIGINLVASLTVMYLFGSLGMMVVTQVSFTAAVISMAPFVIGDTVKSVLAAFVAKGVHAAVPGLLPYRAK